MATVRCMLLLPAMACPAAVSYRPRDSRASPLYQLVANHADELRKVYDNRFAATYGPWQAHWTTTLEKFRRCGDLHFSFARVVLQNLPPHLPDGAGVYFILHLLGTG